MPPKQDVSHAIFRLPTWRGLAPVPLNGLHPRRPERGERRKAMETIFVVVIFFFFLFRPERGERRKAMETPDRETVRSKSRETGTR